MARFAFVGPSYRSRSVNADCQMTMNWYPETLESGAGKSVMAMYQRAGLKFFAALPGETRVLGQFEFNGRMFAAGNNSLFEILASGLQINRGDFTGGNAGGQPVVMVANQAQQLLVAAGGNLYVLHLDTNFLQAVDMSQLKGPVDQVVFVDTYFVAMIRNSNTFQLSNLLDGTTWLTTLDSSKIEVFPENVVSMVTAFREIWFLGNKKSAAYYNTGDPSFPFSPIPSGYMEQGATAKWAACLLDNTGFWIGGDERGAGIGWRASGYTPQRITTHAIEFEWQSYPRIDDAVAYAYQISGHTFWHIYFPSANKTWVYDAATNMWHEEGFWDAAHGVFRAHRSRCHCFAFGKHLVGDYATGNIYEMSLAYLNDFGNPIVRIRRSPHISNELQWQLHKSLQIDMEVGATPQNNIVGIRPFTTFTIDDGTGQLWAVRVNGAGNLTSQMISSGEAQDVILLDPTLATAWRLGVVPVTGNLVTTSIAPSVYPQALPMVAIDGTHQFNLQVSALGILATLAQGSVVGEPQMSLRWSDDGGHTWSNYYTRGAGQSGQFKKRVIWRRLGRARDRVYELSCSDEFPCSVVDAYLEATGYSPTERIGDRLRKMA